MLTRVLLDAVHRVHTRTAGRSASCSHVYFWAQCIVLTRVLLGVVCCAHTCTAGRSASCSHVYTAGRSWSCSHVYCWAQFIVLKRALLGAVRRTHTCTAGHSTNVEFDTSRPVCLFGGTEKGCFIVYFFLFLFGTEKKRTTNKQTTVKT